jgi:aryl-alcohol dehydrogenase-like predicted oxidoreductase
MQYAILRKMQYKTLANLRVSSIGVATSPMSHATNNRPDEASSMEIMHRALDQGVNFFDVADVYVVAPDDMHDNERLFVRALQSYTGDFGGQLKSIQEVVIATKGGLLRPQSESAGQDEPTLIRKTIQESSTALGRPIDIWLAHAYDTTFQLEPYFAVVKEAIDSGLIRHVGVSNFSLEQIERAAKIVPIVAIQNEFNLWHRNPEFDGILDYCNKNNLIFLPWSPVSGGSGYKRLLKIKYLEELATEKKCSIFSLILAWLRQKSNQVVPVSGIAKMSSLEETLATLSVTLSREEGDRIDEIANSKEKLTE